MAQAVRKQNKKIKQFCMACFTGFYPTGDVSKEILAKIERERDDNQSRKKKPQK